MRNKNDKAGTRRFIVFTDLDGSLLNQNDYSWEESKPALERIRELNIPLVICTSKTRMEVERIQSDLGISGPFIVENGGGIFYPPEYSFLPVGSAAIIDNHRCIPLGTSYSRIRSFMEEAGKVFSIRGFGDMDINEIAARTGLTLEKAAFAKERDFTEPFVLENNEELNDLSKTANLKGFMITRGARFHHCMGYGNDMGDAVRRVSEIFSRYWNTKIVSLGFGDRPNDFPLLQEVDIPVLIPHYDGSFEALELPGLIRAKFSGSMGWNEAALRIIQEMKTEHKRTHKANVT